METPCRTMKKYIIRRPFPPIPRCLTLDGGFATQLTEHVGNRVDGDPLWSARFNATNPAAVQQTHLDFLRAGAQVISTNTYQATVVGYMHHLNLLPDASADLIRSTIALAKEAREQYLDEVYEAAGGPESPPPKSHDEYEDDAEYTVVKVDYSVPLIVGSIGPYGAHLNDGSEYTGDYADRVTKEEIMQYHRHRMQIMAEEGVDAVAIETVPCALEADALVELMTGEYSSLRFWMSFQCKEDGVHLAHGEVFADVAHAVWQKVNGDGVVVRAEEPGEGQLMAVGVNCLNPALVSGLLKALDAKRKPHEPVIPSVIYPNSGEMYSVAEGWTGKANCVALQEYVPEWVGLGARFIGGCCRTYARDITPIAEQVKKANDAAAATAEAAAAVAAPAK